MAICRGIQAFCFTIVNSMAWLLVAEVVLAWELGKRAVALTQRFALELVCDCMRIHAELARAEQTQSAVQTRLLPEPIKGLIRGSLPHLGNLPLRWDSSAYRDLLAIQTGQSRKIV